MLEFDEFKKASLDMAKQLFSDPGLDGCGLFFAETGDPAMNALWVVPFTEQQSKEIHLNMLSVAMTGRGAKMCSAISLAWLTTELDVAPSESKTRREVLISFVTSVGGQKEVEILDVVRGKNKVITDFVEDTTTPDGQHKGRFLSLINKDYKTPPADLVSLAEASLADYLFIGKPFINSELKNEPGSKANQTMH